MSKMLMNGMTTSDFARPEQPQLQSTFLRLPAELRNEIYEMAFASPDHNEEVEFYRAIPPGQALLQSCQKIYMEARLMYRSSARHFWQTANFTLTINQEVTYERMGTQLRKPEARRNLDEIRHMKLKFFKLQHGIHVDCIAYTLLDRLGLWTARRDLCPPCFANVSCSHMPHCTQDTRYIPRSQMEELSTDQRSLETPSVARARCTHEFSSCKAPLPLSVQVRWLIWRLLQLDWFYKDSMSQKAEVAIEKFHECKRQWEENRRKGHRRPSL